MTPPTCPSGKPAYPQPVEKITKTYSRTHKQRLRFYACPECGWYHLGRGRVRIKRKEVANVQAKR